MRTHDSLVSLKDTCHPNVLIVEDEEDIRTLLNFLCEGEGYDVLEASNGLDAIAETLENPPDVAIVDYYMPRMDGERTARALRSLAPDTHIIAFSGSLVDKPYWADSFVVKSRMFDLPSVIRSVGRAPNPASVLGESLAA